MRKTAILCSTACVKLGNIEHSHWNFADMLGRLLECGVTERVRYARIRYHLGTLSWWHIMYLDVASASIVLVL